MTEHSRPVLARKARLRFDAISQAYVLLSPERGLVLNATATAVAQLCNGDLTVADLIARLAVQYPECPPQLLAQEVRDFLQTLERRGLLQEEAA